MIIIIGRVIFRIHCKLHRVAPEFLGTSAGRVRVAGTQCCNKCCGHRVPNVQLNFVLNNICLPRAQTIPSSILAWRIPLDRGAWRAAVHGVTKSRTQLKQLRTQTYLTKIFLKINFPLGFTKFLAPVFYVIIFPAIFSCPQLLSSCRPCLLSCISEGQSAI